MVSDTCISKKVWNGESLTRKCTSVYNHVHLYPPVNIRVHPYIQESRYIHQHIFSVRWQKNGHDYKYMNFGRERFALKCPLYSHSSALEKMIKKKKMGDYMDRVESLAYNRTSTIVLVTVILVT